MFLTPRLFTIGTLFKRGFSDQHVCILRLLCITIASFCDPSVTLQVQRASPSSMDFDGDTGQGAEQQDLPPSDGPDGPERAQFDDNLDQKPPAPHRPVFPRINQSQYNSPRPSQPADLFRKQFHRNQVQPQQHNTPFFNLLNTINPRRADDTGSNRPRQSENSGRRSSFLGSLPVLLTCILVFSEPECA